MILVVTSTYPTCEEDYRGAFVRRFSEEVSAAGEPWVVVAPRPPHVDSTASPPEVHWVGRGQRGAGSFGSLFGGDGLVDNLRRHPWDARHLPASLASLDGVVQSYAPSARAIIAHWLLPSGLVAAHGRRRHGRPVWIVCHSGGVALLSRFPQRLRHWVGALLARGADLLTFVTPGLRSRFLARVGPWAEHLAPRCRVLPMGCDCARFRAVRGDRDGPLVTLGRLVPIKGIDRLLHAAAHFVPRRTLRIIGDGPERRRLVRLADRLGIRVDFRGAVSPAQCPQALDGAALAVVPSRRLRSGRTEGLPTAALELLSAGLPLLTTDTWDLPAPLRDAPGVVRVADDLGAIRSGLSDMLGRPWGGERDAARRRQALAPLDWSVIGARARQLLDQALLARSPAAQVANWPQSV